MEFWKVRIAVPGACLFLHSRTAPEVLFEDGAPAGIKADWIKDTSEADNLLFVSWPQVKAVSCRRVAAAAAAATPVDSPLPILDALKAAGPGAVLGTGELAKAIAEKSGGDRADYMRALNAAAVPSGVIKTSNGLPWPRSRTYWRLV